MPPALRFVLSGLLLTGSASVPMALGQPLPTEQPGVLTIEIEDVKLGHWIDHVNNESGWPIALERAKSQFPYLALASLTGTPQTWFVSGYDSHAKLAESYDEGDEALNAETGRLRKADAQYTSGFRVVHAVARKDLSHGSFPDIGTQRYYEVTTFRLKPGGQAAFEAAAKAYGAAAGRSAPGTSFRVYEVVAGMPNPTYLVFSSVASFSDFDKVMADGMATFKAMTAQELAAISKSQETALETETNRFRINPKMSFVPREVRERDPAFWMPKP